MAVKKETPAPWGFTQADLETLTAEEVLRGCSRFLPPAADIPKEFWAGNTYTRIAEALYIGDQPAHSQVQWVEGFDSQEALMKMCLSHIRDYTVDYDYRIAGLGYMISKVMIITPILVP